MKRSEAPKKQTVPFAVNGQRENLLPTTPAGDNTASYDVGFPPVTMILKAAGGLPPKGQDMNQILYELSSLSRWFSAGALNSYDADFSARVGGYPIGSIVLGNDGITRYVSTIDENKSNPDQGGAGWFDLTNGYLKTSNNLAEIKNSGPQAVSYAVANLGLNAPRTATFNTSGSFTVPLGVTTIFISGCAAGGGGGAGGAGGDGNFFGGGGGGGGAGAAVIGASMSVSPGQVIPITVGIRGAGGVGGSSQGGTASSGGSSRVGAFILTGGIGGGGGVVGNSTNPSAPGSPGGVGFPSGSYGSDGNSSSPTASGGSGASSAYGGGGGSGRASAGQPVRGSDAGGYGAGGGGGGGKYGKESDNTNGGNGGAGSDGIIIINW